jgi:hypothetical protein
MQRVVPIVEGDGEVAALPILLRRIGAWLTPENFLDVPTPIRVRRDRFLKKDADFRKFLGLASAKAGDSGWILILLDADDDCPADLGVQIVDRAREAAPHRRVAVVLAKREYEAWFLASATSLNGKRGLVLDGPVTFDPETPRDAKGWLSERMPGSKYREITDQPAFSAEMNLEQARAGSRSFRKLCTEWVKQTTDLQE